MSSSSLLILVRYCIDLVLGVPSKLGFWIYFVKKVCKFFIGFNVNRIKELTNWKKVCKFCDIVAKIDRHVSCLLKNSYIFQFVCVCVLPSWLKKVCKFCEPCQYVLCGTNNMKEKVFSKTFFWIKLLIFVQFQLFSSHTFFKPSYKPLRKINIFNFCSKNIITIFNFYLLIPCIARISN